MHSETSFRLPLNFLCSTTLFIFLSCVSKLKRNSDVKETGSVLRRFHSSESLIWMALWIELVQNRNRFVCGLLSEARRTCAGTLGNELIFLSASSRCVHIYGRPRFRIFSFSRPLERERAGRWGTLGARLKYGFISDIHVMWMAFFFLTCTMNIAALVVVVIVSAIWPLVFTKQNRKMQKDVDI